MIKGVIKKYGLVRLFAGLLSLTLLVVFIFRKKIRDHKVTRAKVEMMNRMSDTPIEDWGREFKSIYDSLSTQIKDTITHSDPNQKIN